MIRKLHIILSRIADDRNATKDLLLSIILIFIGYVLYNILWMIVDSESAILYRVNLGQSGILMILVWMLYLILAMSQQTVDK